jgi:uncharacterized membrane protein
MYYKNVSKIFSEVFDMMNGYYGYYGNSRGGNMMAYGLNVMPIIGAVVCIMVVTIIAILIIIAVKSKHRHMGMSADGTSEHMGHMGYMGHMGHMNHMGMGHMSQVSSAIVILNERYAKGEINDEDYARMKAELMK